MTSTKNSSESTTKDDSLTRRARAYINGEIQLSRKATSILIYQLLEVIEWQDKVYDELFEFIAKHDQHLNLEQSWHKRFLHHVKSKLYKWRQKCHFFT